MREFRSINQSFGRRTLQRVSRQVIVLALLAGFFWSESSNGWPDWTKFLLLALFAAYILFGLACYPKAKTIAENFYVRLLENGLGFPYQSEMKQIPYQDLTISKVSRKNGDVVAIRLKTTFGQSIPLQGLEDMNELYKGLSKRVQ